jgi:hypothetical protein
LQQTWIRALKGVVAIAVTSVLVFGGSSAANAAVGTPSNLSTTFNSRSMTLTWAAASGAKSYTVIVGKKGYAGPYSGYTVSATSIKLSYKNFPYRQTKGSGYTFTVKANGGGSITSTKKLRLTQSGSRVSMSGKSWATISAKINKCLNDGGTAAAAAGAGIGAVAIAAIWVPGIGEVTAAAAAVAIGSASAGSTLVCSVKTRW